MSDQLYRFIQTQWSIQGHNNTTVCCLQTSKGNSAVAFFLLSFFFWLCSSNSKKYLATLCIHFNILNTNLLLFVHCIFWEVTSSNTYLPFIHYIDWKLTTKVQKWREKAINDIACEIGKGSKLLLFHFCPFCLEQAAHQSNSTCLSGRFVGVSQNKQPFSSVYFRDVIHHVDTKKDIAISMLGHWNRLWRAHVIFTWNGKNALLRHWLMCYWVLLLYIYCIAISK